jgi:hypothetical protein
MNKPIHRLSELSFKYLQEGLNEEERLELNDFLNESEANRQFFDDLINQVRINEDLEHLYKTDSNAVWESVVKANPRLKKGTVIAFFRPTVRYAAAVILIAALAGYWLVRHNENKQVAKVETTQKPVVNNDVKPGQYKAKLTLDDGTTMILDSAKNGRLVQQGGITVLSKDGKLVYQNSSHVGKGREAKVLYNTLSTAKGESYATVLSDGTQVWLNSLSSIRYPVTFTGDMRQVEITGEAYFEVAHNSAMPFVVKVNDFQIQVLGTHFNINSYTDEPAMKTTLLQGKVRVRSSTTNDELILAPGEQALMNKQTQAISKAKEVDVDAEVAWRFGLFQFNNADLKTVMRQLERWYDVQVSYEGNIQNGDFEFLGKLPRNMNLSQVLSILEKQDVHFKIEGKKIIVRP